MANNGYPGSYEKGAVITDIDKAEATGCMVFHAGTAQDDAGNITASGGRVLSVTALGENAKQAREKAYDGVKSISWDSGFYRSDIAQFAAESD